MAAGEVGFSASALRAALGYSKWCQSQPSNHRKPWPLKALTDAELAVWRPGTLAGRFTEYCDEGHHLPLGSR